jgi:dissimilatory sulfite reductase (desulfoviridin) alpha/beta subunit
MYWKPEGEAQKALRDKVAHATEGFSVEACFGAHGCPNAITSSATLLDRIEELLRQEDLTAFLQEKVGGPLKHHHQFRVALAECPNACSQVHIKDFGLIGQMEPEFAGDCKECGGCEEACEENALRVVDHFPVIDPEKCLYCGACVRACASEALRPGRLGYRVLVGGKLGRHPRLARELASFATEEEVLRLLKNIVSFYKARNRRGERLGQLIEEVGWENFRRAVLRKDQ